MLLSLFLSVKRVVLPVNNGSSTASCYLQFSCRRIGSDAGIAAVVNSDQITIVSQ